jgi:glutathione S-transferase
MKLLIGNKNYSSWSLRSWLLLKHAGIAFEEERLSFNDPSFKAKVLRVSPAGKVPVLIDDGFAVWDTLAIGEYVAERFPSHGLWPAEATARARARAMCAEMHAGFTALRAALPMNLELRLPGFHVPAAAARDIARIFAMWTDARARHGAGGPFLFGRFGVVDAYYAPVAMRFRSYDVLLPAEVEAYVSMLESLPAMRAWLADALAEHDFIEIDEPYRARPG